MERQKISDSDKHDPWSVNGEHRKERQKNQAGDKGDRTLLSSPINSWKVQIDGINTLVITYLEESCEVVRQVGVEEYCLLGSCTLLKVSRCFRGTYLLHLQGRRISQERNQCESRWQVCLVIF
jgi:hypothetical protein